MFRQSIRFLQKGLTVKKIWNVGINRLGYALSLISKKSFVWGMPPTVMVEPTDICNLKCPLCPSGNGSLKRVKGVMSLTTFQQVVDQIKDTTLVLMLWNQGEPFVNPDFLKMVNYASEQGLFTLTSTNANLPWDAEAVVRSGLDSLIVSLDGASQDTYNQYRVNGQFAAVVENTKQLVAAKKKLGSSFPLIRWQFLVMKHNEHEMAAIRGLAQEIGVDSLIFKTVQIYSKEDIAQYLPSNPKFRRYKISGDQFELKFGLKNRCLRMWNQPVINWNGDMAVCCFDKDIEFPIGNVLTNSVKQIWAGASYQKMRNTILHNRGKIPMCRNCGEGVSLTITESDV